MSRKYIQHLRSKQVDTVQEYGIDKDIPKVPQPKSEDAPEGLDEGEIAINFADGHEVLCIKNENGEIVKFLNENVIYENEEVTATALSRINNQLTSLASGQPYVIQLLDNCDPNTHGAVSYIAKDINGNEIRQNDIDIAIRSKRIILVVYHGGCFVPAFSTPMNGTCMNDAFTFQDGGYYFVNIGDAIYHSSSDDTDLTFDGSLNRIIRVIRFGNNTWSMVDIDFYTKQEVDQKIADAGIPDMTNYYTKSEIDNAGYLTSETQLSTNTMGNGNVVTNITVNGHQITLTKESTFLTQDEVQALIDEVVSGGVDLTNYYTKSETNGFLEDKVDYLTFSSTQEMQNTTNGVRLGTIGIVDGEQSKDVYVLIYRNGNKEWYDVTTDNTGGDPIIAQNTIETLTPTADLDKPIEIEVGDTYDEAFSKVLGIIEENEHVIAEALTDLNDNKVDTNDLANVAFSGDYEDLINKPSIIPTDVISEALTNLDDNKVDTNDLANVAFSGSFNDLEDKPRVIPNDWQYNALERKTSIAMNNEEQDSSVLISFKEGKMIFPGTDESKYINATTYSGCALGTEEKLTNAKLLTDGAGMIGFYDESNDDNITVRDALINLQDVKANNDNVYSKQDVYTKSETDDKFVGSLVVQLADRSIDDGTTFQTVYDALLAGKHVVYINNGSQYYTVERFNSTAINLKCFSIYSDEWLFVIDNLVHTPANDNDPQLQYYYRLLPTVQHLSARAQSNEGASNVGYYSGGNTYITNANTVSAALGKVDALISTINQNITSTGSTLSEQMKTFRVGINGSNLYGWNSEDKEWQQYGVVGEALEDENAYNDIATAIEEGRNVELIEFVSANNQYNGNIYKLQYYNATGINTPSGMTEMTSFNILFNCNKAIVIDSNNNTEIKNIDVYLNPSQVKAIIETNPYNP